MGEVSERRPVPGRAWKLTLLAADLLTSLGVSPNGASLMGMLFGILGGIAFAATSWKVGPIFWILGGVSIFLRSVFNVLDGVMAHRTGKMTPEGAFLNDFTDRISDVFMLAGWGYAWSSSAVLGWAATSFALLTAVVRTTGKVAGARMHYEGLMSKPVRMYVLIFTSLIMAIYPLPQLPNLALWIIIIGSAITSIQRTWIILNDLRK